MIMSNKNGGKKIENTSNEVKRADKVKFLGFLIDERLSFKNHVSGLQNQVSMAIGMTNRVSNLLLVEVWSKPYYDLIYSS